MCCPTINPEIEQTIIFFKSFNVYLFYHIADVIEAYKYDSKFDQGVDRHKLHTEDEVLLNIIRQSYSNYNIDLDSGNMMNLFGTTNRLIFNFFGISFPGNYDITVCSQRCVNSIQEQITEHTEIVEIKFETIKLNQYLMFFLLSNFGCHSHCSVCHKQLFNWFID